MNLWHALGFSNSPYNASPLRPCVEDVPLLVGRSKDSVKLQTTIESKSEGVCLIAGLPGVGKTSFFNVNQYLLEHGKAQFGRRLLAARSLCPVQPGDKPRDIALRVLHIYLKNIREYCSINKVNTPPETEKIAKWASSSGSQGFSIGLTIMGCGGSLGRSGSVPRLDDTSFEQVQEVLEALSAEVINVLKLEGSFIALDNLENLDDAQLKDTLITFRDTLFAVSGIWWVLIGQAGLGSLIQALDPRVSERISGSAVDLPAITVDELDTAINLRVKKFHNAKDGKALLPKSVHEHLFTASHGEIRFVFKYAESICIRCITQIRTSLSSDPESNSISAEAFDKALGGVLVKRQIQSSLASSLLKDIVGEEITGLFLKGKDKKAFDALGKRGIARIKDHAEFGFKTQQDFSSNFLSYYHRQHLLARQQEGRGVLYKLRGVAAMGYEFGFFAG